MSTYTEKIKEFSTDQIIASIDENFYQNVENEEKLKDVIKTYIEKFCKENDLPSVSLDIKRMKDNNGMMDYNKCVLTLNDIYTKGYQLFKILDNKFFICELFNTIVHELRHLKQFLSYGDDLHPLVRDCAAIQKDWDVSEAMDDFAYGCNPTELDARYYAYKTLQKNDFFEPYIKSFAYKKTESYFLNNEYMNFPELLKDDSIRKLKIHKDSLKNIVSTVKSIALKNGLTFVGMAKKNDKHITSWKENLNNITLAGHISAEIAPDFFEENFTKIRNPKDVEAKMKQECEHFDTFYDLVNEYSFTKAFEIITDTLNLNQAQENKEAQKASKNSSDNENNCEIENYYEDEDENFEIEN